MSAPDAKELHKLLRYEPETGALYWLPRTPDMFRGTPGRTPEHKCANWNARNAGKKAMTADCGNGYRQGSIFGVNIRAHRVAWALVHGYWPETIDHINGDRSDNRLVNLRACTQAENVRNCRVRKHNRLGVKGVQKWGNKFAATIRLNGKVNHLGAFETIAEASAAYAKASAELHGEFGRVA